MRILIVTLFFPPARNAGTENYSLGLATALQARGHDVQVVCAEDWEDGDAYWNGVTQDRLQGVTVNRVHLNWARAQNPNRVLYTSPQVDRWFADFLAAAKPDLVHVTSTATLGVGVLHAVRQAGIPLVLTLMDFWFLCPRTVLMTGEGHTCSGVTTPWECQQCLLAGSGAYGRLHHLLPHRLEARFWHAAGHTPQFNRVRGLRGMALDMDERKALLTQALAAPDVILSHSAFVARMFAQAGCPYPVTHLPNGHDLAWLADHAGKTPSDVLRVGYMGQIHPIKGVHVLIDAFRQAEFGDAARLRIWGNLDHMPGYAHTLRAQIGDDPTITLAGRFDRADLGRVLADIDVLVVPSVWYENAPLVIQEAFATGTPVITTDFGGMREAVTDHLDGLLFPREDVAALAARLRRLVDEPDLLPRLRAGIRPVRTIGKEVDELETLYARLVSHTSGASDARPAAVTLGSPA